MPGLITTCAVFGGYSCEACSFLRGGGGKMELGDPGEFEGRGKWESCSHDVVNESRIYKK